MIDPRTLDAELSAELVALFAYDDYLVELPDEYEADELGDYFIDFEYLARGIAKSYGLWLNEARDTIIAWRDDPTTRMVLWLQAKGATV